MTNGSHRKLLVMLLVRSLKVTSSKSWEYVTNMVPSQTRSLNSRPYSRTCRKPILSSLFSYGFQVGETVLMRPSGKSEAPYVARVQRFEADAEGNVNANVIWYYRPEETIAGRKQFHGKKELFSSDDVDTQSADTILDKCIVHTYKSYTSLEDVRPEDYFCRFDYDHATGCFTPDFVLVYCKCEMPSNPDVSMVQCEACKDCYLSRGLSQKRYLQCNLTPHFLGLCEAVLMEIARFSPYITNIMLRSINNPSIYSEISYRRIGELNGCLGGVEQFGGFLVNCCMYHPTCINMTDEQAKQLENFTCDDC
ncbi:bromo adjacent homology (BAH) domain, Zinc finger, RING/FYVE/PHD-type [Artemisia annua]|uniref:Bromo adjacent homology (BAH) domain, Zinc finger, RING/FYVE/PHD-type n=1 Tax=Artemisia annua TaxID=35608 RepID=A0A2U1LCW3_ARTAN|nr:bromo adjacent homology (BAH) domain, Zinc finger, RING/FYVE/PHD-type [Artemisia annua]